MLRLYKAVSLLTLTQALILATSVQAQERPAADTPQGAVVSTRSPALAGTLELLTLPTVGYAYAGNWLRGVPSALLQVVGVGLVIEQQFCLCIFEEPPPCEGQCILGIAMAIGGRVWAVIDAAATARRANEDRRTAALGPVLVPTFGGAGPGLGVRIPFSW